MASLSIINFSFFFISLGMLIHYAAYLNILRHNVIIEGIQQYLEAYNDYKCHTKISLVIQRSL